MMLHGGNMAGKCTNKPITAHRRRSGPGPLAAVGLDPSREPHQLQVPQRLQHCIMHLAYRAAAMQLGITPPAGAAAHGSSAEVQEPSIQ